MQKYMRQPFISTEISGQIEPTTSLFGEGILSIMLYRQSICIVQMYYSSIIKTFLSVQFTTVHANLIEQTTSWIELVVLKRRTIVVIRKDFTCLLLHQLEQHRRIFLVKRNLQNFGSTCGSLRKSFSKHDMKNT